jgi:hypothetical protein
VVKLAAISRENVDAVWSKCLPHIREALKHEAGELTESVVYSRCVEGDFILLIVVDGDEIIAVQTVEIVQTPARRIMGLVTTGGIRIEEWQDLLVDALDGMAQEAECDVIHTRGRLGWLRKLKRNGYKPLYFIAEKVVNYERKQEQGQTEQPEHSQRLHAVN